MPVIDLRNLSGEVPRTGPSVLADNEAQRATNCRVVSGELRPLKQPLKVFTPANQPTSLYRISNGSTSQWLTWVNDVNVVPGPIADVTDNRIYYTGDTGGPKKTNFAMASAGTGPWPGATPTTDWLYMGVPNPTVAPTLAASGSGTGTAVNRAYVYTWLSTFGSLVEESGPSPAANVNWLTGQVINVSALGAPPTSGYNITGINLYRTVVGTSSVSYELVATLGVVTTYTDSLADAAIIGTPLPSLTWQPPPSNLAGLVNIGYGMLAGFVGNQVWISEPYKPHSWPLGYMQSFPNNIVGLGTAGPMLIVCTDNNPWLMQGTTPLSMTVTPVSIWEPCVSKRSIVSNMTGCMYASPNGIVGMSSLIQGVISDKLIEREAWQEYNPTTMMGAIYDGRYFGFYTMPANGIQPDSATSVLGGRCLMLDKADSPVRALYVHMDVASFAMAPPLTFLDFYAVGCYTDRQTGNLYAINQQDNCIYQIDGDPINTMTVNWKSKRFIYPAPVSMAVVQADADYNDPNYSALAAQIAAIAAANAIIFAAGSTAGMAGTNLLDTQTFNGSNMQDLPEALDVNTFQVLVYSQGVLLAVYSPQNNEPMRLPGGIQSQVWEVEISNNFPMRSVTLSTSMSELRAALQAPTQQKG